MSYGNGWWAEMDEEQSRVGEYCWHPTLQVDGIQHNVDVWLSSQEACEEFIRREILGQGMLDP